MSSSETEDSSSDVYEKLEDSSSTSGLPENLEELKLEDRDINILLIGSTGVGKSTFINSVANYLVHRYMDKVEKRKLITLIPSSFTVKDKNNDDHTIHIGPDEDANEVLQIGASATQNVKVYVIRNLPIGRNRVNVRLIDTPGTGDTRGIEQDELNCDNIIKYISTVNKLHGICILLKPTNPRMTIFFQYCLSHILCRLEKAACSNIFFVFTHTRGSNYDGGQTLPVLQQYIFSIYQITPDANIYIVEDNTFCFDNEGFKYLAAKEKGSENGVIEFTNSAKENFKKSWETSAKCCWDLIKKIQRDNQPYFPANLSGIENARKILLQLSTVIAKVNKKILENDIVIDRLQRKQSDDNTNIEELKKKQYIEVTDVHKVALNEPNLVCTSISCADVKKVQDDTKWHYKTICHENCTEIPRTELETIGCPEIVNCFSINSSTKKCIRCGCDFSIHMLLKYRTELKREKVPDKNAVQQISNKKSVLSSSEDVINDHKQENAKLHDGIRVIKGFCKKIVTFLRTQTILPYNNCYKDYVDYLKIQKQTVGDSWIRSTVNELDALLNNHLEYKKLFDENSRDAQASCPVGLSEEDINEKLQNELFTLEIVGKLIREEFEQHSKIINIDESPPEEIVYEFKYEREFKKNKNHKKTKDKSNEQKKSKKEKRDRSNEKKHRDKKDKQKNKDTEKNKSQYRKPRSHSPPPPYRKAVHNSTDFPRHDNPHYQNRPRNDYQQQDNSRYYFQQQPPPDYAPKPYGHYDYYSHREPSDSTHTKGNGASYPECEFTFTVKGSSKNETFAPHAYGPPPHYQGPSPSYSQIPPSSGTYQRQPHSLNYGPSPPYSNYGPSPPYNNYGPPPPVSHTFTPSAQPHIQGPTAPPYYRPQFPPSYEHHPPSNSYRGSRPSSDDHKNKYGPSDKSKKQHDENRNKTERNRGKSGTRRGYNEKSKHFDQKPKK